MNRADANLAAMRTDPDSRWAQRLTATLERVPAIREDEVNRWYRPGVLLARSELAALRCASHGMEAPEAAVILGTTPRAVWMRLRIAQRKLRAKNTTHAVALAIRQELIP